MNDCLTKETESNKTMIKSEEVSYKNSVAGITISATLALPSLVKPTAAVILVAGYGPNDRDYDVCGHKLFQVLERYLVQQDIAVLRFDKRGVGKSTGDYSTATSRDFADDVLAGIEYLKMRKEIDLSKIGLIGHSEGGMISCMVAAEPKKVAFVVLMSGVVQTDVSDLVLQTAKQLKADGASDELIALDGKLRTQFLNLARQEKDSDLAKIKIQELMQDYCNNLPEHLKVESDKIPFAIAEAKIVGMAEVFNSPWYRYFLNCKPADILAKIQVPVLALYGGNDWITSADPSISVIRNIAKNSGNKDITALELPGLNHSLQRCKTGALAEYSAIKEEIAPEALKSMSEWISTNCDK